MRNMLTTGDVAKMLRISRRSVQRMINNGELKGAKVCKKWLVREESIETYLKLKEQEAEFPNLVEMQ